MSNKKDKNKFNQFHDQVGSEDSADLEREWKKKINQARNAKLIRVLFAAIIIIGIIFAITFNVVLPDNSPHSIVQYEDSRFLLVQTDFPHLKILMSSQMQTFETKMIRGTGQVFQELISWLQGNLQPHSKVLYIPNQNSGTSILAIAIAYYLHQSLGGRVDIFTQSEFYRQMVHLNAKVMNKNKGYDLPINLISKEINQEYQFIVIENNDYTKNNPIDRYKNIVEIKKTKWNTNYLQTYFKPFHRYEIFKGKSNQQIRKIGNLLGYSLSPLTPSTTDKQSYKITLLHKIEEPSINLCPQNQPSFKDANHLRNLVEYFRNKTLLSSNIYYDLQNPQILQMLLSFRTEKIYTSHSFNFQNKTIKASIETISPSKNNYFILTAQTATSLSQLPPGKILILITNKTETNQLTSKTKNKIYVLSTNNNNGCFYPPPFTPLESTEFNYPAFLLLDP